MSWLFSRALVVAFSAAGCSAGEPSAQLSVMPTPQPFWRIGRTKGADKPAFLTPSQFGLTCERLTADRGAELLMSYLAAFPVRTSALQEAKQELTASAADCGWKWPASFAKFDPLSRGWKTRQISLIADSIECSPTWPRSGSMRDGECLAHVTLARGMTANASGLKLPTLLVPNGGRSVKHATFVGNTAYDANGKKVQVDLRAALRRLPTLTVHGNYNRKGASPTSGDGLATALRKMPTLAASDWKGRSGAGHLARHGMKRLSDAMPDGGPLNPTWCEWFMGFPMQWTALGGSATRKSRLSQRQRGADCRSNAA